MVPSLFPSSYPRRFNYIFITLQYPPELYIFVSQPDLDTEEINLHNITMIRCFICGVIETFNNQDYNFALHSTVGRLACNHCKIKEHPECHTAGSAPYFRDVPNDGECFWDSVSLNSPENLSNVNVIISTTCHPYQKYRPSSGRYLVYIDGFLAADDWTHVVILTLE